MLIKVFDKWVADSKILKVVEGNAYPFRNTEWIPELEGGASIILDVYIEYNNECGRSNYLDHIWFKNKTVDEVAAEINKQIKASKE